MCHEGNRVQWERRARAPQGDVSELNTEEWEGPARCREGWTSTLTRGNSVCVAPRQERAHTVLGTEWCGWCGWARRRGWCDLVRGAEVDHQRRRHLFLRAVGTQNAGRAMVDPNCLFQNVGAIKQEDTAANLLKSKHLKTPKTGNTNAGKNVEQ